MQNFFPVRLVLDAISLAFHHDMFSHKNDGVIQAASQITKRFFKLKPIMKRISDLSCRSLDIARNRYENESSRFQNRRASFSFSTSNQQHLNALFRLCWYLKFVISIITEHEHSGASH